MHSLSINDEMLRQFVWVLGGMGYRGAMIPAKMTSEPQDLQNYLQAPQNWPPSLNDAPKPPAILSPRPASVNRSKLRFSDNLRRMIHFEKLNKAI